MNKKEFGIGGAILTAAISGTAMITDGDGLSLPAEPTTEMLGAANIASEYPCILAGWEATKLTKPRPERGKDKKIKKNENGKIKMEKSRKRDNGERKRNLMVSYKMLAKQNNSCTMDEYNRWNKLPLSDKKSIIPTW